MTSVKAKQALPSSYNMGELQPTEINIDKRNKVYPLECIFSKMEIASIAMHATISMDILKLTIC